jgi:class 3 adenylate cyclase/tetratricopeptide (TPR) repeat protein
MTDSKDYIKDMLKILSFASHDQITRIISAEWERCDPETRGWTQDLYLKAGTKMLECGQTFLGYDILTEGLAFSPGHIALLQQQALALARLGETGKAQDILQHLYNQGNMHPDTIGILARTYKDRWQKTRDEQFLKLACDIYQRGFLIDEHNEYNGINAATLNLLLGEHEHAQEIASRIIEICKKKRPKEKNSTQKYWLLAALGEAYLIVGNYQESVYYYKKAFLQATGMYGNQASTIRQARLILDYWQSHPECCPMKRKEVNFNELRDVLHIGNVVLCIGHMIDRPDRQEPRFPSVLESEIRQRIKDAITAIDARIGYCSAACGTDILFIETMLERNAEVHVCLPFRHEDFIETSVRFAGEQWVERFRQALKRATSVIEPFQEAYLGDTCLFEYGNKFMLGKTLLHADTLGLQPTLLAIWDGKPGDGRFGTADMITLWKKRYGTDRLYTIPITDITPGEHHLLPKPQHPTAYILKEPKSLARKLRSMLFADVVGFSKLMEAQIPYFMHAFIGAIGELIQSERFGPAFKNTWGDELFCIFKETSDAARFALELRDLVMHTDWEKRGLPANTNIRIALHAGPVYSGIDLIAERLNYFGSHVSRSARLEPITMPGNVYVSEPFAALLRTEYVSDLVCEYIGKHALAKDYGVYPIYLLRRAEKNEEVIS